jgi:SAM-dependent methyltransferase
MKRIYGHIIIGFFQTFKMLPQDESGARLLELGASPYFMSLIIEHFTNYTLFLADGIIKGSEPTFSTIRLANKISGEEILFNYKTFNVEIDQFPYPDDSFDLVLCCELIEHLILDPSHMLCEIHRILKPGGHILITTPNVLVLRNLVSLLIHKRNIYYPYSGYGIYGRHNREWTITELVQVVSGCGFQIEKNKIVDTYPHLGYSKLLKVLFPSLRDMLIVVAHSHHKSQKYYPENIYESFPKQYSPENPIPSRLQEKIVHFRST